MFSLTMVTFRVVTLMSPVLLPPEAKRGYVISYGIRLIYKEIIDKAEVGHLGVIKLETMKI